MGTIVISTNATLDGVIQDPDGGEGSALGNWFPPAGTRDREAWAEAGAAEAMRAEALLLGRRSYEFFASRWASRGGEWADRLNGLPKYVVSSVLSEAAATWGPTTLLRGDAVKEVAELKRKRDGDVVVYASYQLGHTLLEHGLVDELRLFIFPVVLGSGHRLFGETGHKQPLRLTSATTLGEGVALLTYDVVRGAEPARGSAPLASRADGSPGSPR